MSYLRTLLDTAALQRGFLTPDDARELGVPTVELSKMASRGALDHRSYGVYRIAGYPAAPGDELMEAVLWAGGGLISHESALAHWALADANPRRIHITVPRRVRRAGGDAYRLWIASVAPRDVDERLGIPVTSPARTIDDCAVSGTDPGLIDQAVQTAVRRDLISRGDRERFIDRAGSTAPARRSHRYRRDARGGEPVRTEAGLQGRRRL